MRKIIDCITFFDNNFMFNLRYRILENQVDYFVVCESLYDHKGQFKDKKFIFKNDFNENKIKYILLDKPFPKKNNGWENQALQRDYLLDNLDFASEEDYIFFSDPDEIVKPEILNNFELSKKYGIFLQNVFNYKFNLYNRYESPWEGTRVSKKKNLKSIDYMRQKVKLKNLKYSLYRIDKEKNIEIFDDAGWHFNNIMTPEEISLKLKTFAHTEYSSERYSSVDVIKKKINNKVDLFERGHEYQVLKLNEDFPEYILENLEKYGEFIIK
jgi:beta-1,4-mannosyl-glycoprotein beta-1,4-N-acetylglucosaminyltransferase